MIRSGYDRTGFSLKGYTPVWGQGDGCAAGDGAAALESGWEVDNKLRRK